MEKYNLLVKIPKKNLSKIEKDIKKLNKEIVKLKKDVDAYMKMYVYKK